MGGDCNHARVEVRRLDRVVEVTCLDCGAFEKREDR